MRRETQHALLLLLGGALLRIAADSTYLRYVRPSHRWLLLAAGLVMVVLAVVALWHDRSSREEHVHGHEHGADRHVPWLLVVPVLAIALVAPPALGADAVVRAGSANAAVTAGDVFGPLPSGAELTIAELVARASAGAAGGVDGREVTLRGFVVRRGAAVELARLTIACCAADARPNRVRLAGDLAAPAPDTWLHVRGTVVPGTATAATGFVPTLVVTAADVVAAPPDPYDY